MKKREQKKPEVVRSVGHVCFADPGAGSRAWDPVEAPGDASVEFRILPGGHALLRAEVRADVVDGCRTPSVMCMTGADQVAEFCRRMQVSVPQATARLAQSRVTAVETNGGQRPAGVRAMKGKNGKSVLQTWSDLFAENEGRAKAGEKPWTDEQLTQRMEKEFPESAGKSTMTRVRMFRAHYNTGTHSFKKIGSAADNKLPKSHQYAADGSVVEPGKRIASKDGKAGKRAKKGDGVSIAEHDKKRRLAKKAGGKKKVVKRK